ncbi:hypothetical protein FXO37_25966 [Capsicum annuum]|nr:hypothetical protein FXO37_25966 [Capsicum annuum]
MHVLMLSRAHLLPTIQQSEFHRRKAGLPMLELIDLSELRVSLGVSLCKLPRYGFGVYVNARSSKGSADLSLARPGESNQAKARLIPSTLVDWSIAVVCCLPGDQRLYLRGGFPLIVRHIIYDGYEWARQVIRYQASEPREYYLQVGRVAVVQAFPPLSSPLKVLCPAYQNRFQLWDFREPLNNEVRRLLEKEEERPRACPIKKRDVLRCNGFHASALNQSIASFLIPSVITWSIWVGLTPWLGYGYYSRVTVRKGIKPHTFKELETRAHDMELSIASRGKTSPAFDLRKKAKEFNQPSKYQTEESVAVGETSVKAPTKQKFKEKARSPWLREEKSQLTLKELEVKAYSFPDSDVPAILDELLDKKVIDHLESKQLDEANKVDDPKYYKYHRIGSHLTARCFILKEKIMTLVRDGKIIIDTNDTAKANHDSAKIDHNKGSTS